MSKSFDFESLVSLCRETHEIMRLRAARSVNIELVIRNWLFGWYIVEYQQNGADRFCGIKKPVNGADRADWTRVFSGFPGAYAPVF